MVGENVKKKRKELEWSQLTLAIESGVAQAHISQIESGRQKNPGVTTIGKLAKAMGITVDDLLKGDE